MSNTSEQITIEQEINYSGSEPESPIVTKAPFEARVSADSLPDQSNLAIQAIIDNACAKL